MKTLLLFFLFSPLCSAYELYSLDDMDKMVNRYNFFDPVKMKNHFDEIDIKLMKNSGVSGGIDYFKQNYEVGSCYQGQFKCVPNGKKVFKVMKKVKNIYNDMRRPSELFKIKFVDDKESVELKTSLSFSHSGGWSGRSLVEAIYGDERNYCYSKYLFKVDNFDHKYELEEALKCFKEETVKIKERIPHFALEDFKLKRYAVIGWDYIQQKEKILCRRYSKIKILWRMQMVKVDCPETFKGKVEEKSKKEK